MPPQGLDSFSTHPARSTPLDPTPVVAHGARVCGRQREIEIMQMVSHPNIIQLYEIIETPRQLSACSDEGEWT